MSFSLKHIHSFIRFTVQHNQGQLVPVPGHPNELSTTRRRGQTFHRDAIPIAIHRTVFVINARKIWAVKRFR
eukprot:60902-Pleurochrysis_carterae.AAC.2